MENENSTKNKNLGTHFYVDPEVDILTNLLNFIGHFAVQNICARFSPFKAAQDLLEKGQFDASAMMAFEDVTWDTVFARMKTVEFSNVHSEAEEKLRDMSFYMDYTDMIHGLNADAMVKEFGEASVEISGKICLEIWESMKAQVLPLISKETDIKSVLATLKNSVGPIIVDAIRKYYVAGSEGIDDELKKLFDQTRRVFEKMEHDEIAFFKIIYASLVKGTEVMICNPEYLQLGDRIKSAIKYYTAGVSVTLGDRLASIINPKEYEKVEKFAPGVIDYIPSLISMAVTCAIVITVDKNPLMVALTEEFNKVPTITGNIKLYRENAAAFEEMAAKLAAVDISELRTIIEGYDHLVLEMESANGPGELNRILVSYYKNNKKELPWGNRSLEEHWADKTSKLVFK